MKSKQNILTYFIVPIILVMALLSIQAFCDLELPSYTSSIINDGIGGKGINSNVPEVITLDIYKGIVRISNNDSTIKNSYKLLDKDKLEDKEYKNYIKKYPLLKDENIYILKDLSKDELEELESKLEKPLIVATLYASNNESIKESLNITLPEDADLLSFMLTLDDELFNKINEYVINNIKLDNSMLEQYCKLSITEIYNKIGIDMDSYQMSFIIHKGIEMLLIALLGMVIAIISGYFISKIAARLSYTLRLKVIRKIMAFSTAEYKEFGASSLITRSTNDIEQIKMFSIMFFRIVVFAPILGIGAFIKVTHNPLNWLIGVALIAIFILIGLLFGLAMPKFKIMQKLIDKMNLISREIVTGMPVIRTFNTENYEKERFDKGNRDLTNNNLFVNRLMGIMMPSMMLVMNIISILIVWYGSKAIDVGSLEVGTLLAFITYTMQIIMSFLMISMVSVMLPRAMVSIKRIREILNKKITIIEVDNPEEFNKLEKGVVEFKNVSFKYPDADEAMLNDISFKATPGTTTAIIGSTGSGKSTLINLIPRFFDVTEGEIDVDGVNIKNCSIKSLRDRIGYVPQKGVLFSGTIASNLEFGKENISKKEMEKVAKVSQSLEFILNKEDKFNSVVAEGGSNVSGGQKQRLSIARAIAKNPEIYIFDDSFSALDFKTDLALRKALKEYAKDSTVIIVAQRISTIMNADNIIVLNEGKIVGKGKHKDLLNNCKIYKEIALSQLKEEEL